MRAKYMSSAALLLMCATALQASQPDSESDTRSIQPLPSVGYENRLLRNEFMSYTIRSTATANDRASEWNYLPIEDFGCTTRQDGTKVYTATVTYPDFWTDRTVIMHTEGARNSHKVYIDGRYAGSSRDSGVPSEFELPHAAAGESHTLTIEVIPDTHEPESARPQGGADITSWFLYSQPKTRIVDYDVKAVADTGGDGEIVASVIVENGYGSDETFTLCFDVFSPEGKVKEYGAKEVSLPARGRDTVELKATIYGAGKRLWSAETPNVYELMLFIRVGGRILEYVPVNVGFGSISHTDGIFYRNGKAVELRFERYDADSPEQLRRDIASLRKRGINTLWPHYPQPYWFYDICDHTGMYVIDQANINTLHATGDLKRGGCLSNNPAWLSEYTERTKAMFMRSRNHPCIAAWALGGNSGNGFNLYRTYVWLRNADPARPIVYDGAGGQWNNDLPAADPARQQTEP